MPTIILHPKLTPVWANLAGKALQAREEDFKQALETLLNNINTNYSIGRVKKQLHNFLKIVWSDKYAIVDQEDNYLAIHAGKASESNITVLVKVAEQTNYSLAPVTNILNYKPLHELVLRYLTERSSQDNRLKKLIITTGNEWLVFDAQNFERLLLSNKQLSQDFDNHKTSNSQEESTGHFINTFIAPYLKSLSSDALPFIYINLKDYDPAIQQDRSAADDIFHVFYHILSPESDLYSFAEEKEPGEYNSPVCYGHLNGMRNGFEL